MVSKGLKQVKKEELTRIDPITTSKYNVNDLESEAIRQRYLEREGIDDSEMDLLKGQLPMKSYYSNDYEDLDFETIKVKRDNSEIKAYKRKSPGRLTTRLIITESIKTTETRIYGKNSD